MLERKAQRVENLICQLGISLDFALFSEQQLPPLVLVQRGGERNGCGFLVYGVLRPQVLLLDSQRLLVQGEGLVRLILEFV
jgi:hypothetical protein